MQDIKTHWDDFISSKESGKSLDSELCKGFYNKARHNLQFFAFHPSTPSAVVASEMQSSFFNCGVQGQPFPIISSAGIKPAIDVRMPDPVFSAFLPELPVFPEELLDCSKPVVAALQEMGILKDITFMDVSKELQKRPLSEEEMAACLQRWVNLPQLDPMGISNNREVLSGAVVLVVDSYNGNKQEIPLEEIQTFLNPQNPVIPTNGPLPSHLLPINVNQKLDPARLQELLQWRELTVLEWVKHIVDPVVYTQKREFNILESPVWADCVLQVLGRCWSTLPEVSRTTIIEALNELACIPTSAGMKTPSQAYFLDADIFNDLPVIDLPSRVSIEGGLSEALVDLGVQKHADLQVILGW